MLEPRPGLSMTLLPKHSVLEVHEFDDGLVVDFQ